jgi:3-oxoacyl-[acyl-carrier protein] reductase
LLRDELSLSGRVAVVTGASRGIGRAIAEALAASGAAVGIAYRDRDVQASEVVDSIVDRGGRAWAGRCDVSDEEAVAAFFAGVAEALGPVDILVNNAGITRDRHILFADRAGWDDVLRVNLDAAYACVSAVVRGMLVRRWGRIVANDVAEGRTEGAEEALVVAARAVSAATAQLVAATSAKSDPNSETQQGLNAAAKYK